MKYVAMANPELFHCGYRWLVLDDTWEVVSKHVDQESAEEKAQELNNAPRE